MDAAVPLQNRVQATALLGALRDATDVPLLAALLGERAGSDLAANPLRSAAADALGKIGGERAVTALLDAMAGSKTNRAILSSLVRALRNAGDSRAVPALVSRLGSADRGLIVEILSALRAVDARGAAPHVIPLLQHPSSTIRTYAASALEDTVDDEVVRAMRAATRDPAASVVTRALFYLAKHDAASLPLFERFAGWPQQDVRAAANAGLRRFGTAATVKAIRPLLESRNLSVRSYTASALEALTFRSWQPPSGADRFNTSAFDEWLARNGSRSRSEWAIEALERPVRKRPGGAPNEKVQALAYLDAQPGMARATFERMLQDRDPAVRQRASQAIARFDRLRAAQLLIREFDSRFLEACVGANFRLGQLTRRELKFDFEDPAARAEAKARWIEILTSFK